MASHSTKPGDVLLARFPFGDVPGMKLRPVLALTHPVGPVPEVLVAYISSVEPPHPLPSDLFLDPTSADHRSTGLKVRSVLRLHRLATIHTSSLARRLGKIGPIVDVQVKTKLRGFLAI